MAQTQKMDDPDEVPRARPFADGAGDRLSLPPGAPRRFVLFADAEEEFDWSRPFDRQSTNTETVAELVSATERFNAAGLVPCYLCDFPIVSNLGSSSAMRAMVEAGTCEVGTQLHPWVNPPFDELVSTHNSFTGNLPEPLQRAKLHALTDQIQATTGVRPTVYRAGRYGLGNNTMKLLREAGYRMDVSARSLFDYSDQGGPDYTQLPVWPWRTEEGLIELPLSTAWTGYLRSAPSLHGSTMLRGLLARGHLLSRIPLTPEGVPLDQALNGIRALHDDGLEIFSLSFHTPSVVAGHTPYVRDADDLRTFWAWWDGVFDLFAQLGVLPASYGEVLSALDRD